MRCFVPNCDSNSENVSEESRTIKFHPLPSNARLRAAWLRTLAVQDLPDTALVCSKHFLKDDYQLTWEGVQLRPDAAPSTVPVCVLCLDTESRLYVMSKYKLDRAYQQLTGHALCDQRNLRQTVCAQCGLRLMKCSQFRDKILRTRALITDLAEKHKVITTQHIQKIDRSRQQIKSNFVMHNPLHYDLSIVEHPLEEVKTDPDRISLRDDNLEYDSMKRESSVESDIVNLFSPPSTADSAQTAGLAQTAGPAQTAGSAQTASSAQTAGSAQTASSAQTAGSAQTASSAQTAGSAQTASLAQTAGSAQTASSTQIAVAPSSEELATNNENKTHTEEAVTVQRSPELSEINNRSLNTSSRTNIDNLKNCVIKLSDVIKNPKIGVQILDTSCRSMVETQKAINSCDNQCHIDNENIKLVNTRNSNNRNVSRTLQSKANLDRLTNCVVKLTDIIKYPKKGVPISVSSCHSLVKTQKAIISCDNQRHIDNENINLVTDKLNDNNHNVSRISQSKRNRSNNDVDESCLFIGKNRFTCGICKNMFERQHLLKEHIKTHTEVKPFTREYSQDKLKNKSDLTTHMRSHIGKNRYCCNFCEYKCAQKGNLVKHMKTHTAEKRHCLLCKYKCVRKNTLMAHMRKHY